jgi:hypothetical protein
MLLSERVHITVTYSLYERYKKLGYIIPLKKNKKGKDTIDQSKQILIEARDLPDKSKVNVFTQCDNCYLTTKNTWADYLKSVKPNGKTYCRKCSNKLFAGSKIQKTKLQTSTNFNQWCLDNNKEYLLELWDYTKTIFLLNYVAMVVKRNIGLCV